MSAPEIVITVLFNDVAQDPRLQTAHGMACLIEGAGRTILFDTGGDGHILLDNMKALGKDPGGVDCVVISHMHWDHSGGLFTFLREVGEIEVFMPKAISRDFRDHAAMLGARVIVVDGPVTIADAVHSTGQMGGSGLAEERKEQAIVIDAAEGPVVVTGCAHPSVFNIVKKANEIVPGEIHAVLGGFHLKESKDMVVQEVIRELKGLGVGHMGPSHCTGDPHVKEFRQAWRDGFLEFGCGATIRLRARH